MTTEPNPLTRNDLGHLRQLLAHGRISHTYDELAARGYRYARLANGVVKGDTFSGRIALEFLEKSAAAQQHALSREEVDAIRLALAKAYLDALSLQFGDAADLVTHDVLADEAWKFHAAVFQAQRLDPDVWTLHTPFSLMDAETRPIYWATVLHHAGDFAKEVLLGVATDFIMKRAALDLLAPVEAEQAWRWLQRLHNLDTYRAASEVASLQLAQLASVLPAMRSRGAQNVLDAAAIRELMIHVHEAPLDERLQTKLAGFRERIIDLRMPFGLGT